MAETTPSPSGGPNWLFGLDKLTTPSLDFIGIKFRDKLRAWLSEKARERAMLRHLEKDFLYREIDLLNYSGEQFAAYLESLGRLSVERHLQHLLPLIQLAISNFDIRPERAFEIISAGLFRKPEEFTGGELILFSVVTSALDFVVTVQTCQTVFQLAFVPSSAHFQNPAITDEQIDELLQNSKTLDAINEAMKFTDWGFIRFFAKSLTEAYGFEFDEEAFKTREREADPPEKS